MSLFVKVSNFGVGVDDCWVEISNISSIDEIGEDGYTKNFEEIELKNLAGGRSYLPGFYYDLNTITEAKSFWDLDWSGTCYDPHLKNWQGTGFMDTEGNLYPCGWMEHDDMEEFYFKKNCGDLEMAGWLKIHNNVEVCKEGRITRKQYDSLVKNNIPHMFTEEDVNYY